VKYVTHKLFLVIVCLFTAPTWPSSRIF